MPSFDIDARYDDSRPEGGHAVILISGLSGLEEPVQFKLWPIDADLSDASNAFLAQLHPAVACRNVNGGSEIVIGPAITEHPALNAGSIVELELPEYGVRSELIWPSIVPPARPRRTAHIARRPPASPRIEPAAPLKEADLRALLGSTEEPIVLPSTQNADPKFVAVVEKADAAPKPVIAVAAAASPVAVDLATAKPVASSTSLHQTPLPSAVVHDVVTIEDRSTVRPTITASEHVEDIEKPAIERPEQPRRFSLLPSSPIGAALTSALGVLGVVWLLGGPSNPLVTRYPETKAVPPAATAAPVAVPAPRATAEPAVDGALYHLLNAGPASPRGVIARDITAQQALENAHAALNSPGAPRDPEEGAYWLRKYVQSLGKDETTRRALTQLGSALADSSNRDFDYGKARLAWELASAFGDPVAMCFIGALHENGLGGPVDRRLAHVWYERSKRVGGCPAVDEAITRVIP